MGQPRLAASAGGAAVVIGGGGPMSGTGHGVSPPMSGYTAWMWMFLACTNEGDERLGPEPVELLEIQAEVGEPSSSTEPVLPPLTKYRPEPLSAGFMLLWHPAFFEGEAARQRLRVRAALLYDLDILARVVPAQALVSLARTRIVLNLESPFLPWRGGPGRGGATHVSASWLVSNGLDAEGEGVVEFYNADDYLTWRAEQPMVILHELTHVLGLHAAPEVLGEIERAYEAAVQGGGYEQVEYVLAPRDERRRAYALEGPEEYAAELAEALFGRNDYYPFVVSDLVTADPAGCAAVARLWKAKCPR